MTVKELKEILKYFDDGKEVFIFQPLHSEAVLFEVLSISDNGGNVQINIGE